MHFNVILLYYCFQSTTVITYRPADAEKPVSCSLNELEVFSCVLGLEEETALSIVEPAALHVTIDAARVLHVIITIRMENNLVK